MDSSKHVKEAAEEAYSQVRDQAREGFEQAAGAARPYFDRVATGAADMARQAGDGLEHRGQQLRHAQEQALAEARQYARAHPMASIGVAIAAGFAIGWLLHRR